jgi:hypothetical protein
MHMLIKSCISVTQHMLVPGWGKLEDEAKKRRGGGSYNIVLNPEDVSLELADRKYNSLTLYMQYKDSPATVCVSTETIMAQMSGLCILTVTCFHRPNSRKPQENPVVVHKNKSLGENWLAVKGTRSCRLRKGVV